MNFHITHIHVEGFALKNVWKEKKMLWVETVKQNEMCNSECRFLDKTFNFGTKQKILSKLRCEEYLFVFIFTTDSIQGYQEWVRALVKKIFGSPIKATVILSQHTQ